VACGAIEEVLEPFAYSLFAFTDPASIALGIIRPGEAQRSRSLRNS
jgi:hypothetical protein